jgi:chromosome segregation ATPase
VKPVQKTLKHKLVVQLRINHMRIFTQLFWALALMATLLPHAKAEGKIVKWVDDKGVTHYGDKLPAEAAGHSNSEMNKTGLVVKNNKAYNAKTDSIEVESISAEQSRKDSALLASYSSIEEIDLARDRNIKSDEITIDILNQRISDSREQLKINQEKANNLTKLKRNIPNNIKDNISQYQTKITKTEAEIAKTESNIAQTKARFAVYKARYAELKPNNDNSPIALQRKQELADLNNKKIAAKTRLDGFLKQARDAKQAGKEQPQNVSVGIQEANDEISRVDTQIIAIQTKINETK